jgi:hypothetical protein
MFFGVLPAIDKASPNTRRFVVQDESLGWYTRPANSSFTSSNTKSPSPLSCVTLLSLRFTAARRASRRRYRSLNVLSILRSPKFNRFIRQLQRMPHVYLLVLDGCGEGCNHSYNHGDARGRLHMLDFRLESENLCRYGFRRQNVLLASQISAIGATEVVHQTLDVLKFVDTGHAKEDAALQDLWIYRGLLFEL